MTKCFILVIKSHQPPAPASCRWEEDGTGETRVGAQHGWDQGDSTCQADSWEGAGLFRGGLARKFAHRGACSGLSRNEAQPAQERGRGKSLSLSLHDRSGRCPQPAFGVGQRIHWLSWRIFFAALFVLAQQQRPFQPGGSLLKTKLWYFVREQHCSAGARVMGTTW